MNVSSRPTSLVLCHQTGSGARRYYGLWAGHFVRGELPAMEEIAQLVLDEVETRPASLEALVAIRLNGATRYFAGDLTEARAFLERALAIFDPQRHRDQTLRFAQDIGVSIII